MAGLINKIAHKFGFQLTRNSPPHIDSLVISLQPSNGSPRGNVLLSYVLDPFLLKPDQAISNKHTHHWESYQIAQTFLKLGFTVDVISYRNNTFKPDKDYDYFISARTNIEVIAKRLNQDCFKIVHLDTAHWLTNNAAAYDRTSNLYKRRKIAINSIRIIEPNKAIEIADIATILGNEFTINSYSYANKPVYRIPISTPTTYPWINGKNYEQCRNNFFWFGSGGFVHKGLDLVLDVFKELPQLNLTVCGPFDEEKDFLHAYHKELFESPNIRPIGWIDVESQEFLNIAKDTVALIYPTCAEGGGGSAITCMHSGIIPILNYEASVDTPNCGITLNDCSLEEIRKTVLDVSNLPINELKCLSKNAWEYANKKHTREIFADE